MKSHEIASVDAQQPETDDLFEIASLFPRTTGLPMTYGSARAAMHVTMCASRSISAMAIR
jgi:hypothetical protein